MLTFKCVHTKGHISYNNGRELFLFISEFAERASKQDNEKRVLRLTECIKTKSPG